MLHLTFLICSPSVQLFVVNIFWK